MSALMKLKTLQGHLEGLNGFENPKIKFEQYETPAHLAATALYTIQTQFESIENCTVLDAGCGPGIWSIGAALLGASIVTAVDIDGDVLQVFKENVVEMELTNVDAVQCDFLDPRVARNHIEKKIKDWDMKGSVIAEMKYELPATYRFHKQNSMNIAVDIWRVYHAQ